MYLQIRKAKLLKPDFYYKLAYNLVLINLFLAPILHCIKLLRFGSAPGAVYFYVSFPIMAMSFIFSFILGRRLSISKPNNMELIILLLFSWSILVTFYFGGDYIDIAGNILRIGFSFTCYHTTKAYFSYLNQINVVNKLALFGFWGAFLAIFIVYFLGVFGPFPLYLGLSTGGLFLLLSICLVYNLRWKWLRVFAIFSLFILGGKRGIMLAALMMIFLYFIVNIKIKSIIVIGSILATLSCLLLISTLWLNSTETLKILPRPIAARISPFFNTVNRLGYDAMTSGRSEEVIAVVNEWKKSPIIFLTGKGLGATFVDVTGKDNSTIHITPVALTFIFGFPLAALFFTYLCFILFKKFIVYSSLAKEDRVWLFCFVGSLIQTMSLFTIFQDPIIWMSAAALTSNFKKIN